MGTLNSRSETRVDDHQRGRAVGERPIDDIAVAGHPADVGGTPVDVAVLIVEDVLMRHRREHEIAAGGVQHTLRRAGRARGVEEIVLSIQRRAKPSDSVAITWLFMPAVVGCCQAIGLAAPSEKIQPRRSSM